MADPPPLHPAGEAGAEGSEVKIVCTSAGPAELVWYWLHEVGSPEPEAVFVGVGPRGLMVAGRLGEPDPRPVAGMPPGTRRCPIEPPELSAAAARAAIAAELDRFRECKSLTRLALTGTPVGDAGLTTVRGFTKLTHLDLRGTRATERGAAGVARALQACEVTWDGGVLRPKR